ncbi:hypothetical protein YB2330_003769 [Saitoella coloradoensis]
MSTTLTKYEANNMPDDMTTSLQTEITFDSQPLSTQSPLHPWWKSAIIYQIYPSSFLDTRGTGTGTLAGITSKLPYLKSLGVDCIWLSPIYESPLHDMGYDISDYQKIDPRYGSMEEWEEMVAKAHEIGIKVMMDLVVNHTSFLHAWFKASRSAKTSEKRDWYIWRPPRYDADGTRMPPNNWQSIFRGPAWTYDEATGEYYLHLFCREQPDLNWENPEVRKAVYAMMHFWLSRGVDGFRMDVINLLSKSPGLPDAKVVDETRFEQPAMEYYVNGPRIHEFLREMRGEVLSKYPEAITVGETPFTHDTEVMRKYTLGATAGDAYELDMCFHFELVDLDCATTDPFLKRDVPLPDLKRTIQKWQSHGGWNALYLENHDQPRSVSRFTTATPELSNLAAKMLALMECTLSGTVYVYQGQELGMYNAPGEWGIEEYKDVATQNYWRDMRSKRVPVEEIMRRVRAKARDHARTPMHWDRSTLYAGFTTGRPWMRVNPSYSDGVNAEDELEDPDSVFHFWRRIIEVRKEYAGVLVHGDFALLAEEDERVFAYVRESEEGDRMLVVMNWSGEEVGWSVPDEVSKDRMEVIVGNYGVQEKVIEEGGVMKLRAWEGSVVRCSPRLN